MEITSKSWKGNRSSPIQKACIEIGPDGQKLLRCPHSGCNKVLTSSPGFRYHLKTHNLTEKPFRCTRCTKTFKSANGLKYHREKGKCDQAGGQCSKQDEDAESGLSSRKRTLSESSGYHTISPVPQQMADEEGVDDSHEASDPLTQLAIIATGSLSPLISSPQPKPITKKQRAAAAFNAMIHSYAKAPRDIGPPRPIITRCRRISFSQPEATTGFSLIQSDPKPMKRKPRQATSTYSESCGSRSPQERQISSVVEIREGGIIEHMTLTETRIRFENSPPDEWIMVSEFPMKSLKLVQILAESPALHLKFRPIDVPGVSQSSGVAVIAKCQRNHPFDVQDKGWSSCYPTLTEGHYGIRCDTLREGDVCLPTKLPKIDVNRRKSREANDNDAVNTLSQMATGSMMQSKKEATQKTDEIELDESDLFSPANKRPMNAFLVFARKFRLEYGRENPDKDNRNVSKMLGVKWRSLTEEERKAYSEEASQIAQKMKSEDPNCYKQKRWYKQSKKSSCPV